jgi:hypothetical protein
MRSPGRKNTLLVIGLSVVALCGCTRSDSSDGMNHFTIETSGRTKATPQIDTHIPTPDDAISIQPTGATPQALPSIESAPLNNASIDTVLDELDAALFELEVLLGSTEDWDVPLP